MTNASLSILSAAELLAVDLAPRRDLLAPLLASDGAALVYGPAGIGKSFFALSLAWAVASGGSFLGWKSPRPHRVLYVDGEMGAATLRERLALFGPAPAGLAISAHGLSSGPLLDLSENAGLLRLMRAWDGPELLVLDTLSSLVGLRRGDAEHWDRVQRFLLHQRKHGRAVLLVHHANKEGAMRGSTRREDVLDLVLALRRPDAGPPAGSARFEIHFEKVRRVGAPLVPIVAALETDADGRAQWRWAPADGARLERAAALLNRGLSAREVWEALGISRTTLFRLKAEARARGLLNEGSTP
ncbi:MAG: AAA family ATPase [Reyranella sp.]|uniref:AAA family ATPase n=1 Tax=Reyranella sp. TaxID=1929291 RepID=UPI001ACDC8A6|nr:AAA family ATPase [Reyranella sp.]MBN9089150.1 AAA family ATPase [Reyranella sp.]